MKRTRNLQLFSTTIWALSVLVTGLGFATISNGQGAFAVPQAEQEFELTGSFHLEQDSEVGYLVMEATIPAGSYIYSLTQEGNPPPSRIEIAKSESFQVSGAFKPDSDPVVVEQDPTFGNRTEKHKQNVRFFIPLRLAAGTDPSGLVIPMRFNGQVCSESEGTCMPIQDRGVQAEFGGYYQRVAEQTSASESIRR